MFKCQNCNKVPEKDITRFQQEHKFISKTRVREYENFKTFIKNKKKVTERFITEGIETVNELSVCKDCLENLTNGEVSNDKAGIRGREQRIKIGDSEIKKRRKIV